MDEENNNDTGTGHKKITEVLAGLLEDVLSNWRPEHAIGGRTRYFLAWLGAFSFALPALLMNLKSITELYPDLVGDRGIFLPLLSAAIYSVLPMLLVAPGTKRQSSVRIYLAGFLLPYAIWALVMQFAVKPGGIP
jgi:hypothetical protein